MNRSRSRSVRLFSWQGTGRRRPSRHPENETIPGVFIFRIDAPLIFANAESFKKNFSRDLRRDERPIRLAIIDLQSSPIIDVTAADMIRDLHTELERKGIALRLANMTGKVRDVLRAAGIEDRVGRLDRAATIAALCEQCGDLRPVQS